MKPRLRVAAFVVFLLTATAGLLAADRPARGDAAADAALQEAIQKGQDLWRKPWRRGAKACQACHQAGPNLMTAARMESYPKYDKTFRKVVSGQQKLNQMIQTKAGGQPLPLGSDELNALEAYLSSLR